MTKRFSPKASDYTVAYAANQKKIAHLKKQLREAEALEVSLKAYLMPFYGEGHTTVTAGAKTLDVLYATTERTYLNQDRARAMLAKLGKQAPEFEVTVTTFKIREVKA
jgi:hypothetical protein